MVDKGQAGEPVYDLTRIKAREMQSFFRAARENDMATLADVFARVVVSLPDGRDASDPETYLEMTYYGEFTQILNGMVDAAKKLASG